MKDLHVASLLPRLLLRALNCDGENLYGWRVSKLQIAILGFQT